MCSNINLPRVRDGAGSKTKTKAIVSICPVSVLEENRRVAYLTPNGFALTDDAFITWCSTWDREGLHYISQDG